MLLEEFVDGTSNGFVKAERYLNDGSPSGFSEAHTTSEYTRPRSSLASFSLQQIRFGDDAFIEDLGVIRKNYIKDGCILIHPDMLDSKGYVNDGYYSVEDELIVAPTASGRTVLALEKKYFVKLAYIGYLGRIVRHMSKEIVLSAYEVTKQLMDATKTNKLNPAFGILREDFGRVAHIPLKNLKFSALRLPQNDRGCYEWGVLFREYKPYPYIQDDEFLIPFFALFSQEYNPLTQKPNTLQDKPLLIQLFEKQGKSMEEFLLHDILFPLFNTYFDALIYAGVELEAHAQNMLLTVNKDFIVKRIVCRDFESAGRDVPLMESMGIKYAKHGDYKINTLKPIEPGQKYSKYHTGHSFMFDFKLGEYLVSPLINLAANYSFIDHHAVTKRIKEFNRQFIEKLPKDFFPPDWCYYEKINWDLEGKKREYVWQNDPKYR